MNYLFRHVPDLIQKTVKFQKRKSLKHVSTSQKGQALIVILAFSAILGVGLLSIYNTAQVATTKRELVNAADATAYSGATIIAQGLNYTAYTNRAILANNALIGQMTAMRSTLSMSEWYWKNLATTMETIEAVAKFIPYIGQGFSKVADGAEKFSDQWVKVVHYANNFAQILQLTNTAALGLTNQVIWLSQQVHLADSLASFEPSMVKIAKDNAPDAEPDRILLGTAFGPILTLGMFATQFQVKVRKSKRTLGTSEGPKDEYLNYLTEKNRNISTPAYLGGRTTLPNAIGLWVATGCSTPTNPTAALGDVFGPVAGFGGALDAGIMLVDTFTNLLGPFINPIMCLYERHGGSELVQLDNGHMAWASIDVMAFKMPFRDFRIPLAGGANMSFTDSKKPRQTHPDALKDFESYVRGKDAKKYMGHQNALPADCVEFVNPSSLDLIAVSTDGRTSGNCAVLATGWPFDTVGQGLWGGNLAETTDKVLRSTNGDTSSDELMKSTIKQILTYALPATLNMQANANSAAMAGPPDSPATGSAGQIPTGTSSGVNSATTETPDMNSLTSAKNSLFGSAWMSGGFSSMQKQLANGLNAANFIINPGAVAKLSLDAVLSPPGTDGDVGNALEFILKTLGLEALVKMMKLKVADGVDTPPDAINKVFNVLADGLPPFFWDVRVMDKAQGAKPGEEEDLVFTDNNHDDFNVRRYNTGPLVYFPLVYDMNRIKTSENLGINGEVMNLPDYDEKSNAIRAIGKARIFFRQPSDHWLNRYKLVVTSSLLLPYWQARNESLSYVDKWSLSTIFK